MSRELYRKIQKQLDTYSVGFPATESGIEIEILEALFALEDAELFAELTPLLETPGAIAQRIGRSEDELALHLEDMAARGLLFRTRKNNVSKYGAIPFMHGLLEYKVDNFDRNLAELFEKYFDEAMHGAIAESAELFIRPIPIGESVTPEYRIAPFEDAGKMLEKADIIVVADCICRKEKATVGKGCGKPMETCFMFGSMARYYIDNGMGRQVTHDEALDILKKAQAAGMVTQPATSQNPTGMCSCCGDCCGVLLSLKKQPKPAELVFSNYFARVAKEECTGCEACLERCQMDAISIGDEGTAVIDDDRCIGCGLCVPTCPTEAMKLIQKTGDAYRKPPQNAMEQMMTMAKKRGVI